MIREIVICKQKKPTKASLSIREYIPELDYTAYKSFCYKIIRTQASMLIRQDTKNIVRREEGMVTRIMTTRVPLIMNFQAFLILCRHTLIFIAKEDEIKMLVDNEIFYSKNIL